MADVTLDVPGLLEPGASAAAAISELDRILEPYGSFGAIPRAMQFSHWTLDNELKQLQSFGVIVPLIFFGVAAFILNVALTRAMTLQRPQIATLKALGYANHELAWHYLKWALVIAVFGAVAGTAAGGWLGAALFGLYNDYFRFPMQAYQLSLGVALAAAGVSLTAAALGALVAVSRAVRVPPAEAMRPAPPLQYHASLVERAIPRRLVGHATRMVLRNLGRQPLRALATLVGIALATSILVVGFFFIDATEELIETQFFVVQRQDVSLSFVEPVSRSALHEIRSYPGVQHVEPYRSVPVRLRHGRRSRQLAILGLPSEPTLNRIVDRSGRVVRLPPEGLVLNETLADVLQAREGDQVTLEVLVGARQVRQVQVASLVDEYMGLSAYMESSALHRLLREGESLSGAHLQVDDAALPELFERLKATPAVAGVNVTAAAIRSFEETMAQNMWVMTLGNLIFAGIIAFGVVYNAARISLSERQRELASLRVLGFTRAEISLVLLGELALMTLLALPLGVAIGYGLSQAIVASIDSEVFRIPVVATPQAVAWSALGVEEQRVNVVIDFEDPAQAWRSLGDAYRVEVRIVIWQADYVLKLPTSSLFRHGAEWAVFTVAGGRARLQTLDLGRRNGREAQVLSGLEAGEQVVVHPSNSLEDGSRVTRREG